MTEVAQLVDIRRGERADISALALIDEDAVTTIRNLGVPIPARTPQEFRAFCEGTLANGTLLVAEAPGGAVVGYVAATRHAGWIHLEELAVALRWRRLGLASALLDAIFEHGNRSACIGFTLTTDREFQFNAPFYRRRGFVECVSAACPAHLGGILQSEMAAATLPSRRVGMLRRPSRVVPSPEKHHR